MKDATISHPCPVRLQKIPDRERNPLPKACRMLAFDLNQDQKQGLLNTDTPKALFSNSRKKKQNYLPVFCQWKTPKSAPIWPKCQMPSAFWEGSTSVGPKPGKNHLPETGSALTWEQMKQRHSLGLGLSPEEPHSLWAHRHKCPSQTSQPPSPSS